MVVEQSIEGFISFPKDLVDQLVPVWEDITNILKPMTEMLAKYNGEGFNRLIFNISEFNILVFSPYPNLNLIVFTEDLELDTEIIDIGKDIEAKLLPKICKILELD
ncbi:hypothetical protein ACFLRF_03445 [Candidatus Altiarchaeota archaeon]